MRVSLCFMLLLPCVCMGFADDDTGVPSLDKIMNNTANLMFEVFKINHNKQYSSQAEEEKRRLIFKDNYMYMMKHSSKSYKLGINEFFDLTHDEFLALYTGFVYTHKTSATNGSHFKTNDPIPDQVDWRKKGYVTPVKNQGHCGSCWAFSTTGTLEGQLAKNSGRLVSLSEQQLVDCSSSFGNNGCAGGLPINAYRYISSAGGIESEEDYPYEAKNATCRFNESLVQMGIMGFAEIKSGDEETLQQGCAIIGPISVGIDASHRSFQMYSSGIYDEPACSSTKLDHGVLVVGYGTNPDYWLVKNSWGTSWGDQGYIKMSRNKQNQCGIATAATYPLA